MAVTIVPYSPSAKTTGYQIVYLASYDGAGPNFASLTHAQVVAAMAFGPLKRLWEQANLISAEAVTFFDKRYDLTYQPAQPVPTTAVVADRIGNPPGLTVAFSGPTAMEAFVRIAFRHSFNR